MGASGFWVGRDEVNGGAPLLQVHYFLPSVNLRRQGGTRLPGFEARQGIAPERGDSSAGGLLAARTGCGGR